MYKQFLDILAARWFIHSDTALEYLPLLLSYINGAAIKDTDFKSLTQPFALGPNLADQWDVQSEDVAPNSILVLPLDGPITSWRAKFLIDSLHKAESNPNIIAGILNVNSPGGMVFYTDIASDAIKNSKIPFVSFVENIGASAAMWWMSGTKKRFLSSKLDRVGSIGIMTSFMDMSKMLKDKLSIDVFEKYADKSTRKNEEIRSLLEKGDDTLLIKSLNFANEIFHKAVQDNMGISKDSEVFQGAVYYAEEAISLGLADEISSFDTAANYVYQLGMKNSLSRFLR